MYRKDLDTFLEALDDWEKTELAEIEAGPRDKKKLTASRKKTAAKRKPKKQLDSDSDDPDDYVPTSKAKPSPKKLEPAKPKAVSKPEPPKSKEAKPEDKKQKTITEMFKVPDKPALKRIVVSDSDEDSDNKVSVKKTSSKKTCS